MHLPFADMPIWYIVLASMLFPLAFESERIFDWIIKWLKKFDK